MAVASADLFGELDRALGGGVAEVSRRPSRYRTSFSLEELDVTLEDGTTLALVFKSVGLHALSARARGAKPDFLYDPLREIEAYESILAESGLGTAVCYGTVVDRERDRFWLFLEKVPGVELYQVGELETWRGAARWLALLHDHCQGAQGASLLRYDRDFYRLWLERARGFGRLAVLDRLAPRYEEIVERLAALPATFIHGEFYASNVLVDGDRVCPVDWEMAALGPGLVDLAALTAGAWSEEERADLAQAYRDASPAYSDRTSEDFLADLDCCRLHLALQWLGWSADWTPPREHLHDWQTEALELAGRLGL